jgi:hypothetical protein
MSEMPPESEVEADPSPVLGDLLKAWAEDPEEDDDEV